MNKKELKFAICGSASVHTERFINKVNDYPGCCMAAICCDNEETGAKIAEDFGCEYTDSYEAVLKNENIDAVLIVSPLMEHYGQIKAAALSAKHVFVEKPAFFTSEEGLEIKKLMAERNLKFVISDPIRTSMRQLKCGKKLIEDGILGKITMIRVRCAMNQALVSDDPAIYEKEKTGGGILEDIGCHAIHMLYVLNGLPDACHAAFSTMSKGGIKNGVEDNVVAVYEYADGILGTVETSSMAGPREDYYLISGTKGTALCLNSEVRYTLNDGKWMNIPEEEWPEHDTYPLYAWVDSIREDKEMTDCGIDEAIAFAKMSEAAREASAAKVSLK